VLPLGQAKGIDGKKGAKKWVLTNITNRQASFQKKIGHSPV
jgi:hypothetical protein